MQKRDPEAGFNIIELTIVLSIVSALVGVVVVGREIAASSKVVAVISEFGYYAQAVGNFREQYKFRPGDLPSNLAKAYFDRGYTSPDCADAGYLGDGQWDPPVYIESNFIKFQPYEVDYGFIQLSIGGFIKQAINFDPCNPPSGSDYRVPGIERPSTDFDDDIGYTFVNTIFLSYNGGENKFLYGIRIGKPESTSDAYLTGGVFNSAFHKQIDAKIDQPDTPVSGKYVVSEDCYDNSTGVYYDDTSEANCTGNLIEIEGTTGLK